MPGLPDAKHLTRISRALTSTLRHNALSEGLKLRNDGSANVGQLLAMPKFQKLGLDFPILQHIVETNEKQRFKMIRMPQSEVGEEKGEGAKGGGGEAEGSSSSATAAPEPTELLPPDIGKDEEPSGFLIRATQGHSIAIESSLFLKPITADNLPPICIHATFYSALDAIISSGHLSRMARTHIHCAAGLPTASKHPVTGEDIPAVKSGMRFDAEVLVYVDMAKALADGVPFWTSENGVILSEGVESTGKLPLEYVERIEDYKGRAGGGDLWTREDGVVKAWPQGGKKKQERGGQNRRGGKR